MRKNLSVKYIMIFTVNAIFLVSLFSHPAGISATITQDRAIELFVSANKEYQDAQRLLAAKGIKEAIAGFKKAALGYEELIRSGYINGQIYYNLGNAYYRQDKKGLAILYYRRAYKLMPRNADLKANLKIVKAELEDKELEVKIPDIIKAIFFLHFLLNLNEATGLAICSYISFMISLLTFTFMKFQWLKRLCVGLGTVVFITAISLGIKIYTTDSVQNGIVISKDCDVRYGPGQEYEPKFKIHEGAEFRIDDIKDKWYKVYVYVNIKQYTGEEEAETSREYRIGWLPMDKAGII